MEDILIGLLNELASRAETLIRICEDENIPVEYRIAFDNESDYLLKLVNKTMQDINESIRLSKKAEEDLKTLKHDAQYGI